MMECVERRSLAEIEETCGGGMKRSRIPIARKKAALKEFCRFPSEENKTLYKRLRNQTRKIVARAMSMEAEQVLNDLYQNFNSVFCFLRRIKKEGKDLEGGRCLRGRDKWSGFIEEDRAKIWKEHMEKIIIEENEWNQMMETDVVERPM